MLFFPIQSTLLHDIDEAAKEECNEKNDLNKTLLTQIAEIDRVRVEEDHLHVEKDKQDSNQEVLDTHGLAGVSYRGDTTLKVDEFVLSAPLWAQQMGNSHHHDDEPYRNHDLQRDGEIVEWRISCL